jgi:cytochrome c556
MHKQYSVTKAPFVVIKKEMAAVEPDWPKVREATQKFLTLAVALEKNEPTIGEKSSWKTFIAAHMADAKAMDKAAETHDKATIVAAHRRLTAACTACHKAHRYRGQ